MQDDLESMLEGLSSDEKITYLKARLIADRYKQAREINKLKEANRQLTIENRKLRDENKFERDRAAELRRKVKIKDIVILRYGGHVE